MLNNKGFKAYKKYWEDQASFMNKAPWHKDKILKLTLSTDYGSNLKELQFSTHSLRKNNGKHTLRVKVPHNYNELDNFESKSLELLGINESWLINICIDHCHCLHR